jgi:hypothetical protein
MLRQESAVVSAIAISWLLPAVPLAAAEYGTPAEAKAMLEKAVAAVKADKPKALAMFTKGEGGFKDRDLYPYCGGPDGNFTAHPTLVGKSLKDLKDKAGKPLGRGSLRQAAKDGSISRGGLRLAASGSDRPSGEGCLTSPRLGDQVCAVGYYK